MTRPRVPLERLTGGDLMQWQADTGPFPQHIGAVLLLDGPVAAAPAAPGTRPGPRPGADAAALAGLVAGRLGAVPALRRRPVRAPLGGGGPYWADDDRDPAAHVTVVPLPAAAGVPSGDVPQPVLDAALAVLARRFPSDRSPWRAAVLDGPGGPAAVVVVLHHALADGLAGLAVLGALADPGPPPGDRVPDAGPPSRGTLTADAVRRRLRALHAVAGLPGAVRALRDGRAELGRDRTRAPRSVLNRRTGPRRVVRVVDVAEEPVRAAGRARDASVNDVLLVAVGEALRAAAAERGEVLDPVVVSVPVGVRADRAGVGNAVGVMPVPVPTSGPLPDRLDRVRRVRRERLDGAHGRSMPLVLAAFRVLRVLGLVDAFASRQRLVTTLATAVPPLPGPLAVGGHRVVRVVPLVPDQGNVTVAFASVRYAGRYVVTVMADPDNGPDVDRVTAAVEAVVSAPAAHGPTSPTT